jgi:hypothetical protein
MVLAAVAGILLLVAVGLVLGARATAADGRLLAREGVPIEAEVMDRQIDEDWERTANGNRVKRLAYHVTLRYHPEGRAPVLVRESVTKERYDALAKGARITVTHAPSDPRVFEFQAGDRMGEAWLMQVIGLAMGALALGAGVGAWALRRAGQRLG